MKYDIHANPFNPVEYLACCGIFEILSRFDPEAVSWWNPPIQGRFIVESSVDESSLLDCLVEALSGYEAWQSAESPENGLSLSESGEDEADLIPEEEGSDSGAGAGDGDAGENDSISLTPLFHLGDMSQNIPLDWWYETLSPDRRIKAKSAWKMYAGQQTVENIVRKMVAAVREAIRESEIGSLTELLRLTAPMTGRFGFDPRSTRNALEAGFSPNDLNQPVATYVVAELMAGIGAALFFPPRTRENRTITSARGWIDEQTFRYAVWLMPLPLPLCRIAASGSGFGPDSVTLLEAPRASRDKYSNFKMASAVASRRKPVSEGAH